MLDDCCQVNWFTLFCYEPLIKMITVQSLWHIIIQNRYMSQDLNQYSMVTIMHSVNVLYLQNFLFLGLSMKFLSGCSTLFAWTLTTKCFILSCSKCTATVSCPFCTEIDYRRDDFTKKPFFGFQYFGYHVSVEHDEKHQLPKLGRNRFMGARDMAAWIPN